MIITLAGKNGFALKSDLDKLVTTFVNKHGELALERVDGEEADFAKIQEALTGLPFLAAKKMVLLRAPGKNKQFVERFEQLLSDLPDSTEVIIVEPKLDKRLAYYKYLKKNTDFRDFVELDQPGLSRWLESIVKQQGGTLSGPDARYLIERAGLNQQLLSSELEKLLLYDKQITRQSIDLLVEPTPQSTVFQLLEAAFAGNIKRALELYGEQRALKVEPQQIIAMLAWQLHVLAIIKAAGDRSADRIASESRLNPYVVRKSQSIARKLTLAELKKLVRDLLDIDVKTKSVAIDPDDALQQYLLKLAS
jgi:DNA polymerase-3 subunit delta